MNRYEILMLANPAITQDEASAVQKSIESLVKQSKGEVISFEKWGKCRLAYPVRKHDYGVYYLTRFEMPNDPQFFKEVKSVFAVKYDDSIMRHIVVKLDPKQTLEYRRPQSVEEAPAARDVDKFLRENKMDGLLEKKHKGHDSADMDRVEQLEDEEQ